MKNEWNVEIPSIEEIIARPDLRNLIASVTHKMLRAVGEWSSATDEVINLLFDKNAARDVLDIEKLLHNKIQSKRSDQENVQKGMRQRARTIAGQIEKYLQGESLADVGCGHGLVAWSVRKHFRDILLLDIVDYRDEDVALPFVRYAGNELPPFERSFDCSLLITVLHHATSPLELLNNVWEHTRRRLIIIESVFGVGASKAASPLPNLDQPTQLAYAVFCDWFYNRVLNQDISVPYNFNTPDNWRQIFRTLPATITAEEDLGVDLDIVPEHHFLFVLDKNG